MEQQGEIILYQPDESVRMEVRIEDETVWLTQAQIVELFQSSKANISEHLKNIYKSEELIQSSTVRNFRTVRQEGNRQITRNLEYYNLDVIISVGYRVNTKRGIQFRQWANKILKEHILRGYSISQRLETLGKTVASHSEKIDFFVRTSLPPVEGIFFDGQIFDAYAFATNLIKSAKNSLILIDNHIDEDTLLMLSKRTTGVDATIYTQRITPQLQLDLTRHNNQYPPINIRTYRQAHDRFLIIDQSDVYHIGASLKDLGKETVCLLQNEYSGIYPHKTAIKMRETESNNKVLLGMSGGTDSSVAALLLQDAGYEVTGITFRFYEKENDTEYQRQAYQLADTGHIQDNHRKKDRYKASGKKDRYCDFKPLNSIGRPAPLLIR